MMGGFGGGGGGGLTGLARNRQVYEELNLSDEQLGQLVRFTDGLGEERREMFSGGFRDLSDEERQEAVEKLAKKVEKTLSEILRREQFQRLKQIELQQQGVRALSRDDMIQALKITDDQQQELQSIREEIREETMELFQGARDMSPEERGGLRDKMQDLQKGLERKAMGVLSSEQKTTLKNIMGEPFELEQPRFEGFGRGGFGRGPGAGGRRGGGEGGRRGEGRSNRPRRPEA
jgi:hypothetical protein